MSEKNFLFLLCVFSALCFGAHLDAFEANLMEARNFVTAREMLQDGHWWETTMNGFPRLEKPPLPTWISAIFGSLNPKMPAYLLRIPAAIMGLLLVVWTYFLAKDFFENTNAARWASICAASSLLIIEMAKTGTWDIYYVSFAIGSFVYFFRGLQSTNSHFNFLIGGMLFGCSILSKGPVAGIMFIAFLSALFISENMKAMFKQWKGIILFGLLAGLIGFSWPFYNFLFLPDATEAVINKESITWTTKHVKPFYFYLVFPIYSGVWAILLVIALIPKLAKKTVGTKYWSLIIWIAVTLFFFSLLPMKKERYLLPVIPIAALLLGKYLQGLLAEKNRFSSQIFWAAFGILGIGLALSPLALIFIQNSYPLAIQFTTYVGVLLLSGLGLFLLYQLRKNKLNHSLIAVSLIPLIVCLFLIPTAASLHYKNPHFISPADLMKNQELANQEIYGAQEADMRVVYAIGKKLLPIEEAKTIVKEKPIYAIIEYNQAQLTELFPACKIEIIDSSGHHKTAKNYGIQAYKISLKK